MAQQLDPPTRTKRKVGDAADALFTMTAFVLAGSVLSELVFGPPDTTWVRYIAAAAVALSGAARMWARL